MPVVPVVLADQPKRNAPEIRAALLLCRGIGGEGWGGGGGGGDPLGLGHDSIMWGIDRPLLTLASVCRKATCHFGCLKKGDCL